MFVTVVDQCRNVLNIEKCPMDQFILRAQIVLSIKDQKHLHDFMGKPEDVWIAENLPNFKYVDHDLGFFLLNVENKKKKF